MSSKLKRGVVHYSWPIEITDHDLDTPDEFKRKTKVIEMLHRSAYRPQVIIKFANRLLILNKMRKQRS